ncbi:hypothetical protein EIP91_004035 [Steccherinum ochraceum]|uniref:Uncharacterized protein n=1 Tax=Steccherinum ochraceum TaxID=92696 RepID=A0A4R0RPZ7_9APHY|nr:hypothetical protein EIP91_004035 [Steccherinum ochraceum]
MDMPQSPSHIKASAHFHIPYFLYQVLAAFALNLTSLTTRTTMRFITTAALVALAATATTMSAPVDDTSQETELYRRFADIVDTLYARGLHDGLHARSYDDRLERRAPHLNDEPIIVHHPDLGRVPIQDTPGYQPMPKAPGTGSTAAGTGNSQQTVPQPSGQLPQMRDEASRRRVQQDRASLERARRRQRYGLPPSGGGNQAGGGGASAGGAGGAGAGGA